MAPQSPQDDIFAGQLPALGGQVRAFGKFLLKILPRSHPRGRHQEVDRFLIIQYQTRLQRLLGHSVPDLHGGKGNGNSVSWVHLHGGEGYLPFRWVGGLCRDRGAANGGVEGKALDRPQQGHNHCQDEDAEGQQDLVFTVHRITSFSECRGWVAVLLCFKSSKGPCSRKPAGRSSCSLPSCRGSG